MIISAMPTIGKTTLAKDNPNIIDLDSGLFNDVRDNPNWIYTYCNVALYLESKGYIVLVSFNPNIHSYLKGKAEQYLMVGYDYTLKDYCIQKAKDRYDNDPKNQSLRTLNWITKDFDKIVSKTIEISNMYDIDLILIDDPNYNLKELLNT